MKKVLGLIKTGPIWDCLAGSSFWLIVMKVHLFWGMNIEGNKLNILKSASLISFFGGS